MTISSVRVTRPDRSEPLTAQKTRLAHNTAPGVGSSPNRGLLRVEEAAEWLGLGRTKAYELVYRGTLPSVTIG